jgi:hypothetical protein
MMSSNQKNNSLSHNDEEEMKNLQAQEGQARSQSLYCRSSDCEKAELEDFELIKVIGQGSFGKVR